MSSSGTEFDTVYLKNSFRLGKVTAVAFVRLTAVYDIVNHRLLIKMEKQAMEYSEESVQSPEEKLAQVRDYRGIFNQFRTGMRRCEADLTENLLGWNMTEAMLTGLCICSVVH